MYFFIFCNVFFFIVFVYYSFCWWRFFFFSVLCYVVFSIHRKIFVVFPYIQNSFSLFSRVYLFCIPWIPPIWAEYCEWMHTKYSTEGNNGIAKLRSELFLFCRAIAFLLSVSRSFLFLVAYTWYLVGDDGDGSGSGYEDIKGEKGFLRIWKNAGSMVEKRLKITLLRCCIAKSAVVVAAATVDIVLMAVCR